MAEPLRNPHLEDEKLASMPEPTAPLPPALPGTPPAYDEEQGRQMRRADRTTRAVEGIGEAVGSAVGKLRHRVRSGLRVVGGKARIASHDVAETARETASEWSDTAKARLVNWRYIAQNRAMATRRKAMRYSREYPLQTLGMVAGAAFVIGFALRIWRSNSE